MTLIYMLMYSWTTYIYCYVGASQHALASSILKVGDSEPKTVSEKVPPTTGTDASRYFTSYKQPQNRRYCLIRCMCVCVFFICFFPISHHAHDANIDSFSVSNQLDWKMHAHGNENSVHRAKQNTLVSTDTPSHLPILDNIHTRKYTYTYTQSYI